MCYMVYVIPEQNSFVIAQRMFNLSWTNIYKQKILNESFNLILDDIIS